jgi:gas vesicle protein
MNIQSYINGFLAGAVIGVLFAPRSGAETRRRIARSYEELKQSVNKGYDVTRHAISDELKELTDNEKEMARERTLDIKNDIQASAT